MDKRVETLRYRAEELRTIAQDWMDKGAQESLLRIAQDYEQMAETREHELAIGGKAGGEIR
jgi:hypothetical protein